ncbi:MAG: transcriptional regulator [Neisseria sp.]|nr:transcriptional regulator [Neisseria sp.]
MQPFRADIRPSEKGTAFVLLLHIAAAVVFVRYFDGWRIWLGLAALAAAAAHAWRVQGLRGKNAVLAIETDTRGDAVLHLNGRADAVAAKLLPQSLAHHYFCLLVWQTDGGRIYQPLLPDMVQGGNYRRLLLWARYGMHKQRGKAV